MTIDNLDLDDTEIHEKYDQAVLELAEKIATDTEIYNEAICLQSGWHELIEALHESGWSITKDIEAERDGFDYGSYFSCAVNRALNIFKANETKHQVGINLDRGWQYEAYKSISHMTRALCHSWNKEDNCFHIDSALSRAMKACKAFHENQDVIEGEE